jgi:predicted ArsR family transcriptional regulator
MNEVDIRKAVTEYTRDHVDTDVSDVVESVAAEVDVSKGKVRDELNALEKNGFVYIVNQEVKVA